MSDHTGYFDEDGNELTREEVDALGDDVEVVEEEVADAPAAPQPAAQAPAAVDAPAKSGGRVPKALIAGVAAVVVLVGGGLAYGMSQVGNENTVEDVRAGVSSKSAEVSAKVEDKKQEVEESATWEPVTSPLCLNDKIDAAAWNGTGEKPKQRLNVVGRTALPEGIKGLLEKRENGEPRELVALQTDETRLGLYVSGTQVDSSTGDSTWWKVTVSLAGAEPVVLGEGKGSGNDVEMRYGACATIPEGSYWVTGRGGDDAATTVELMKPVKTGDFIYAVAGDDLLKLALEHKVVHFGGGDAASSSSAEAEPGN